MRPGIREVGSHEVNERGNGVGGRVAGLSPSDLDEESCGRRPFGVD